MVSPNDCDVSVVVFRLVCEEVDLFKELLLMMLEFSHDVNFTELNFNLEYDDGSTFIIQIPAQVSEAAPLQLQTIR